MGMWSDPSEEATPEGYFHEKHCPKCGCYHGMTGYLRGIERISYYDNDFTLRYDVTCNCGYEEEVDLKINQLMWTDPEGHVHTM